MKKISISAIYIRVPTLTKRLRAAILLIFNFYEKTNLQYYKVDKVNKYHFTRLLGKTNSPSNKKYETNFNNPFNY